MSLQAQRLFQVAQSEGYFRQHSWDAQGLVRHEVNLHAMTAGVAMLSVLNWLLSLKARVDKSGAAGLQRSMAIVTDKGKSSKEQGNLVVKEAVAAMMNQWQAPFRYAPRSFVASCLHIQSSAAVSPKETSCKYVFEQLLDRQHIRLGHESSSRVECLRGNLQKYTLCISCLAAHFMSAGSLCCVQKKAY